MLAGYLVPCVRHQEGEAVVEPLPDPGGAHHVDVRGGQLDGERKPVQCAADCRYVRGVGLVYTEVRLHRRRALREQVDGGSSADVRG